MRQQKKPNIPVRPTFAMVVDGDDESWYLQMLRRNERNIKVTLRPELPQKKTLNEQYLRVIELANDYDKVFWIIDCDVVKAETRTAKKGTETAQQELDNTTRR